MSRITLPLSDIASAEALATVLERVRTEKRRVALTHDGAVVAVLVPPDELELLESLEAMEDEADCEACRLSLDEIGGADALLVSWDCLKGECKLK